MAAKRWRVRTDLQACARGIQYLPHCDVAVIVHGQFRARPHGNLDLEHLAETVSLIAHTSIRQRV